MVQSLWCDVCSKERGPSLMKTEYINIPVWDVIAADKEEEAYPQEEGILRREILRQ